MTKTEFLTKLSAALEKQHIADAAEITAEYEQHFAFKLADGYTEEEIAAKLGDPTALAAQFAPAETTPAAPKSGRGLVYLGLGLAEFGEGVLFLLLFSFGLVLTAAAIAFALTGLCLIGRINPVGLLPLMPYAAALLFGCALLALSVLTYTGCVWYGAYLRQSLRAFGRFRSNTLARLHGGAALPPLPARPQLRAKRARRLRKASLLGLTVFAVLFIAGSVVAMLQAGGIQFWHVWGWFGYAA